MIGLAEKVQVSAAPRTEGQTDPVERLAPFAGLSGAQIGAKLPYLPIRGSSILASSGLAPAIVEGPETAVARWGRGRITRASASAQASIDLARGRGISTLADLMSASITPESGMLLKRVELALERGDSEIFEYGTESDVASEISRVITEHGSAGLNAITAALGSALVSDEVATEVLRSLGAIEDRRTRDDRIRFLAHQLHTHPSPRRRYAAAVALADINAPAALRALEQAADSDSVEDLRRRFHRLLQLLRS